MIYEEFSQYPIVIDKNNPFCNHYVLNDEVDFYIEPVFYTMLKGFKDRHTSEDYQRIINRMIEVAKKNKKVVFVGNFENPQTEVEGYIYLEVTDITDPLQIFVEDKSRGSDYGD